MEGMLFCVYSDILVVVPSASSSHSKLQVQGRHHKDRSGGGLPARYMEIKSTAKKKKSMGFINHVPLVRVLCDRTPCSQGLWPLCLAVSQPLCNFLLWSCHACYSLTLALYQPISSCDCPRHGRCTPKDFFLPDLIMPSQRLEVKLMEISLYRDKVNWTCVW